MTDFLQFSREAAAKGDLFAAYRLLVSAVENDPGDAQSWYELGERLEGFKKHPAAVEAYYRAAAINPEHKTLVNLGLNLGLVGRFGEARRVLEQAIDADPTKVQGYLQLAQVLYASGMPSIDAARRAVVLDPDLPIAHLQLAFSLMTCGHWLEGFREHEWRFQYALPEYLHYPYPLWRGEETGRLVVCSEQGLGDSIQMMRYLGATSNRAERLIWMCHREMYDLAKRWALQIDLATIEIIPMPAPLPDADAFCPMLSLPVALGIERPEGSVYIMSPQHGRGDLLNVGIVWAGSPNHQNAQYRDMPLTALLPLVEIPGARFYSLQVGAGQIQLDEQGAHGLISDLSGRLSDMADTVDQLARLDLVISVDTAVAHLAGAMGKQVFMIVNQRARDWRWGRHGVATPWYREMRIFARALDEDWGPVVTRVAHAVRDIVGDQGMPF